MPLDPRIILGVCNRGSSTIGPILDDTGHAPLGVEVVERRRRPC